MNEPVVFNCGFVARELKLTPELVQKIIDLLEKGMPVSYIAHFQKDETGDLAEAKIRAVANKYVRIKAMFERKQSILRNLQNDQKLTPELERSILDARTERRLEDIYLAYKPRKQTEADFAREKGLEPLALSILQATEAFDIEKEAALLVDPLKELPDTESVLKGVVAILSEKFAWNVELRQRVREHIRRFGTFISQKTEQSTEDTTTSACSDGNQNTPAVQEKPATENVPAENAEVKDDAGVSPVSESVQNTDVDPVADVVSVDKPVSDNKDSEAPVVSSTECKNEGEKSDSGRNRKSGNKKGKKNAKELAEKETRETLYHEFFNFRAEARTCPPSRLFDMLRAEKAKAVEVRLNYPKDRLLDSTFENVFSKDHPFVDYLKNLLQDTFNTTILPSMEKELRREFIDRAEMQTLDIIERNLRNLVLLRPLDRRRVLAIDPGFNHGCKLAALDEFGNILELDSVFTTGSGERKRKAAERISGLLRKFRLSVVGIGNGTGSRETENFIANLLSEEFSSEDIGYTVINEVGASAYAASPLGKEELPSYNILQREAISVGRRIQDTLQELVKIDPALLGIGAEVRDLKSKDLRNVLAGLLEYAVNFAGTNLNQASASFLKYISGLNPITAQRICDYRKKNGPFKTREDLKKVPGLTEDAYHYAIGFLRIPSGYEPLDSTWIHPDQYEIARKILEKFGFSSEDLKSEEKRKEISQKVQETDLNDLASEFELGVLAVKDILDEFVHPGQDRRLNLPGLIFKKGALRFEDLNEGMELIGTVQNVVDFGAFIDIGLPQSGLVHISVMGDQFVRDARQKVVLGDIVKVWVVKADPVQKRISLTMIPPGQERIRYSDSKNRQSNREPIRSENVSAVPADSEARSSSRSERTHFSDRNRRSSDSVRDFRAKDRTSDPSRRERDRNRSSDSDEGRNTKNRTFSKERSDKFDKKQGFSHEHSTLEIPSSKAKKVVPLSDEMKKGKEPMRSFSDLAQFFGISKPNEE